METNGSNWAYNRDICGQKRKKKVEKVARKKKKIVLALRRSLGSTNED